MGNIFADQAELERKARQPQPTCERCRHYEDEIRALREAIKELAQALEDVRA